MAKEQIVVRVFPQGWTNTTNHLSGALQKGFTVVSSNTLQDSKGTTFVDYILQRENEPYNELEAKLADLEKKYNEEKLSNELHKKLYNELSNEFHESIIANTEMIEKKFKSEYESKLLSHKSDLLYEQRGTNLKLIELTQDIESKIIDKITNLGKNPSKKEVLSIIEDQFYVYYTKEFLEMMGEK